MAQKHGTFRFVCEALRSAMDEAGIHDGAELYGRLREADRKATITKVHLQRLLDGKTKYVRMETANILARFFEVPRSRFCPELAEALPLPSTEESRDAIPEELRAWLCSFNAFIEDRTRGFVGREFVFNAIDEFLANNPSGYFVIRGEPGIGKSALISRLVKTRKYLHHFNIALQKINTARQFLRNICAQLIINCGLPYPTLPDDSQIEIFFNNILQVAGSKALASGKPLVLAVDALDEVSAIGHPPETNVLFLPPSLPQGIFVIATTRPVDQLPLQAHYRQRLELEASDERNIADVRLHVEAQLPQPGIQAWMKARKLRTKDFVEVILKKSEGNFMYLHYVLPEIGRGAFQDFTLENLPDGLKAYYQDHWLRMQKKDLDQFERVYQPVVCVLAAAKQAVSVEKIVEWTELTSQKVIQVLRDWQAFLYVEKSSKSEELYRVYHTTFREFLEERVDPGLRTYHSMISRATLKKAGKQKQ